MWQRTREWRKYNQELNNQPTCVKPFKEQRCLILKNIPQFQTTWKGDKKKYFWVELLKELNKIGFYWQAFEEHFTFPPSPNKRMGGGRQHCTSASNGSGKRTMVIINTVINTLEVLLPLLCKSNVDWYQNMPHQVAESHALPYMEHWTTAKVTDY